MNSATTVNHRPEIDAEQRSRVEKSVRYMKENLVKWDAKLSNADLARVACYEESHLIHLFKKLTGTSPHHFLASLRIQKAKELLLTTDASVTDIALQVGYQSFPTFSRTFTDYVGLSPSEFRKAPRTVAASELIIAAKNFIARNHVPVSVPV